MELLFIVLSTSHFSRRDAARFSSGTSGKALEGSSSLEAGDGGAVPQQGNEGPQAALTNSSIHQLRPADNTEVKLHAQVA